MEDPKTKSNSGSSVEASVYQIFCRSVRDNNALKNEAIKHLFGREKEIKLAYRKARDLPADDDMQITTIHHHGSLHSAFIAALLIAALIISLIAAFVAVYKIAKPTTGFNPPTLPNRPEIKLSIPEPPAEHIDTNTHLKLSIIDPD